MSHINNPFEDEEHACTSGEAMDRIVKKINNEITSACMIPLKLPKKSTIQIVDEARKWFYKNYEDSMIECYHVLPRETFSQKEFIDKRSITLPGRLPDGSGLVFSVHNLTVMGEELIGLTGKSGFIDGDFSLQRNILGGGGGVPYMSQAGESLMYYVITENFFDMSRQLLINKISYNYSRLSRKLKIQGETPGNHVVLEVYSTIPDCDLYEDEIFLRYVVGKTKMQLGTMIMTFGYNLPGNVTLNGDMIRDSGKEEVDEAKEEIKGDEGVDYIYHS